MFRGSVKSTGYPLHLNRREGGASVQSTAGSRGVRMSGSNAGYTMFRGSVKSTGYPLHLNRRVASVQSTTGSRGVRISGSNAGYTIFRGSVKSTGYSLHSPVSPSLPLPCVTVCHHISTGVYHHLLIWSALPLYGLADYGTGNLRNVDTASQPRTLKLSASPLWEN